MSKVILKFCLVLILSLKFNVLTSQNYEVGCFTKIDEEQGNLGQILDSGDQFGYSVENIGDLNSDGINDIIVGAFTDDDGGTNRGAVYVLFLKEDDTVLSSQKISSTEGGFTGALDNNDVFGAAVSYLGDLNNDGYIEVAVGAEYDGDGGYWHGAVWIISLNTDGTVRSQSKISDFEGGFTGDFNGDVVFGTDIGNIGDLNNDGIDDLLVSARRDYDGSPETGAVWVLFMNSDFSVSSYSKISETEGNLNANLDSGDYFGGAVAILKDLDNDGVKEVAVGSYRDDDGGTDYGAIYILFLDETGNVKKHQKISATQGGGSFSLNRNAIFGKSIDGYSDIDSDGLIEILVGCARCINSTTNSQTGSFYLIELNNDGTVSESFPYSYQIGGFEGFLNSGDIFGISISYLDQQDPLKVVVGASKDGAGALWILNFNEKLGDLNISGINSQCGEENNGFLISGLDSSDNYLLSFEINSEYYEFSFESDESGEFIPEDLKDGLYQNIEVRKDGCSFQFSEEYEIVEQENFQPEFIIEPAGCGAGESHSILITNLPPERDFFIRYRFNGMYSEIKQFSSDEEGIIRIEQLDPGMYSDFEIEYENCLISPGDDFEISSSDSIEAVFKSFPVSGCGLQNGEIHISNLESAEVYNISFKTINDEILELVLESDEEGVLRIEDLDGVTYYDFSLSTSSCNYFFEESFNLSYGGTENDIDIISKPNCESNQGGKVVIRNLIPNFDYKITYLIDGEEEIEFLNSDNFGNLSWDDLKVGQYTEIKVESNSCEIILSNIEMKCSETPVSEICYTYPKFFSPNSDGVNDQWSVSITTPDCDRRFECYIFDRYGKLLKVLKGPDEKWDGNFNGIAMPANDYWIKLVFPNEKNFVPEIKNISLIR